MNMQYEELIYFSRESRSGICLVWCGMVWVGFNYRYDFGLAPRVYDEDSSICDLI
jgi:predicted membrane-bound mannosyltransferase